MKPNGVCFLQQDSFVSTDWPQRCFLCIIILVLSDYTELCFMACVKVQISADFRGVFAQEGRVRMLR